jgi:hypothetical protein
MKEKTYFVNKMGSSIIKIFIEDRINKNSARLSYISIK